MGFPSSSTDLYWLANVFDPGEEEFAAGDPDLVSAISLLPAGLSTPSALTSNYFEAISPFILCVFGFWLVSFVVYASSFSLPTMTQDSLHSGIGSPSMTGLSPARSVRLRLAHK